jgi:hypothetical protein
MTGANRLVGRAGAGGSPESLTLRIANAMSQRNESEDASVPCPRLMS